MLQPALGTSGSGALPPVPELEPPVDALPPTPGPPPVMLPLPPESPLPPEPVAPPLELSPSPSPSPPGELLLVQAAPRSTTKPNRALTRRMRCAMPPSVAESEPFGSKKSESACKGEVEECFRGAGYREKGGGNTDARACGCPTRV